MSEEEDEVYIEGDDDDDDDDDDEIIIESSSDDEPDEPAKPSQDQIEKDIMNKMKEEFNVHTPAELRILKDLRTFQKSDPKDLGFECLPYKHSINTWEVHLFEFDKKDPIYQDMQRYKKQTGRNYIELRVSFPPDYPISPPFIRVVQPRCQSRTGRITIGGSICTNVLTLADDGWKPMYDFESLFSNIIAEMLSCEPKLRIDWNNQTPYSIEEARAAFQRVAHDHGWKINDWLPR